MVSEILAQYDRVPVELLISAVSSALVKKSRTSRIGSHKPWILYCQYALEYRSYATI